MVAENMVMDMLLRGRNMLFRGINVCSEKVIVNRNDLSIKERERILFFPVLLLDLLNHRVNRAAISCARFLHCSFIAGVMLCFISIQQGIVSHFMDSANAARCFTAAPAQVKEPK